MRKIQYIYTAITALLLIAFSACQDERFGTNDPDSPSDTPYAPRTIGDYTFADDEIRFAISVDNLNGPKTRAVIGGAADVDAVSGATVGLPSSGNVENISGYTAFETGDEIGLFVVERTDPALRAYPSRRENYAQNVKWVYYTDADPKKSGFIPAGIGEEQQKNRILYPGKNRTVDIYAYYPYTESKDMIFDDADRFVFTVAGNQRWNAAPESDRADLHKSTFMKSDLLWADSGEDGQAKGPVTLNFAHAMSLVELTITADNPHLTNIDQITEVLLLNAMPELHYGGNQAPTAGGTPLNIPMRLVSQKTTIPYVLDKYITRVYRALIPAQTFNAGDELFHLSMGSSTYTYRIAKEFELKAGEMNKYSVILNDRDPNELFYTRDKNANGYNVLLNNLGDNSTDLLIGAPWVNNKQGACYIYRYKGINWNWQTNLQTTITSNLLGFGASLDATSEYLIVGAPESDNNKGATFLYQYKIDSDWELLNENYGLSPNGQYGTSVAAAAIGGRTLFLSTKTTKEADWLQKTDNTMANYVWSNLLTTLPVNTERAAAKILATEKTLVTQHRETIRCYDIGSLTLDETDSGLQGSILALSSKAEILLYRNEVTIYSTLLPPDIEAQPITNPGKEGNEFGFSASIFDISRKPSEVIIGAPGEDNGKGAVYYYQYGNTWETPKKIQPFSLKEGTRFGTSVSIIQTKNTNGKTETSIAVSGKDNVYVFNDITKFIQ